MKFKLNKKWSLISFAALSLAVGTGAFFFENFARAHQGPAQKDMQIDPTIRANVLDQLLVNLKADYIFPERALSVEKFLRSKAQHGDFDKITSAEKYADTLSDLLQEQLHDKHLAVRYFAEPVPERKPDQDATPEEEHKEYLEQQRFNFGFESVQRLKANLGYIELRAFSRPQFVDERITATMALLADTHALIIDLRKCGGGDPDTVMKFASYFFDQPTHLNDIVIPSEKRTEPRWTSASVAGKHYGSTRKISLLIGEDTASACEDFAYAMKHAGRAKLIGETTAGAANGGSPKRLHTHFMMFSPNFQPINPVTKTNWEGAGIAPDLKASDKSALNVAHIALLKDLIAIETDPKWKERYQKTIEQIN